MKSKKVYKVLTNFFDPIGNQDTDNFSLYRVVAIDVKDAIVKAKSLMIKNEYVGSVECVCWLD